MTLSDRRVPNHVKVLESSSKKESNIFDIQKDRIQFGTGESVMREFMVHDDAVAVVALREGESGPEVLLISQYRHPLETVMWEIPAGLMDVTAEPAIDAAKRELAEEAEIAAENWYQLINFASSPGCSTEVLKIFLATGISDAPVPDGFVREAEEAEIEKRWVPLSEVEDAVFAGDLKSPTLVGGVLAASRALARGAEFLASLKI